MEDFRNNGFDHEENAKTHENPANASPETEKPAEEFAPIDNSSPARFRRSLDRQLFLQLFYHRFRGLSCPVLIVHIPYRQCTGCKDQQHAQKDQAIPFFNPHSIPLCGAQSRWRSPAVPSPAAPAPATRADRSGAAWYPWAVLWALWGWKGRCMCSSA